MGSPDGHLQDDTTSQSDLASPAQIEGGSSSSNFGLPLEILTSIFTQLSNRDIKNVRLTCRALRRTARLRFDRLYLSANQRNIDVFIAVATHDIFRHQVVEIVWDDARLEEGSVHRGGGPPAWFQAGCERSTEALEQRDRGQIRPAFRARRQLLSEALPYEQCWVHYQKLLEQQRHVLSQRLDVQALETYGLSGHHLPHLRRVTITPLAHGFLFNPLYQTPMIRAFPPGFVYPIPETWPGTSWEMTWDSNLMSSWNSMSDKYKDKWRGFRIVTRLLAEKGAVAAANTNNGAHQAQSVDLIVQNKTFPTGINATLFNGPRDSSSGEYHDLVTILRQAQPRLRRLDLPLLLQSQHRTGWPALRSGLLHDALAHGTHSLEEIHLCGADIVTMMDALGPEGGVPDSFHNDGGLQGYTPLQTIFPLVTGGDGQGHSWSNLRHFELSGFYVRQDDLLDFLTMLIRPSRGATSTMATLRSVELNFLSFLSSHGSYQGLLNGLRDEITSWNNSSKSATERPAAAANSHGVQPQLQRRIDFKIGVPIPDANPTVPGRAIWLEREVTDFLYGDFGGSSLGDNYDDDGEREGLPQNPFGGGIWGPNQVPHGTGVVRDALDPAYEQPWTDQITLIRLGIKEWPSWLPRDESKWMNAPPPLPEKWKRRWGVVERD